MTDDHPGERRRGGDVIVGIDGTVIRSHEEFQRHLIVETHLDEELAVGLIREDEHVIERATLGERPRANAEDRSHSPRRNGRRIPIE